MRIQLASDLHLEFLARDFPAERIIAPADGVDVLVIAGDIANGTTAVERFADWPVEHVLFVAGNHEFYDHSWEQTRSDLRAAAQGTKVRFLDDDVLEIGGARFLGCTLWTDFLLLGPEPRHAMAVAERSLCDYTAIRTRNGRLRASDTQQAHVASRAWLERELDRPFHGKTVVVSHHAPHPLSIHPRYAGDPVNAGFVSDLTPLLSKVDLWMHGHSHESFDYTVDRCRVVANPAGYVMNRRQVKDGMGLELENRAFNKRLTLDL